MPRAKTVEQYVESLEANDQQRLLNARRIRKEIRRGSKPLSLSMAVLGITSSVEELTNHLALAAQIDERQGQPLVVINQYYEGQADQEPQYFKAGIIAGRAVVDTFFQEKPANRGSTGYVIFAVPVERLTHRRFGRNLPSDSCFEHVDRLGERAIMRVSHLVSMEPENPTSNPAEDYKQQIDRRSVLVGREEIYTSPLFAQVGALLLELEKGAAAVVAD